MANKLEGYAVSLPLTYDSQDGPYLLNKRLKDNIQQNFKGLILTSPGERIMLPTFGAGARRYLFESYTNATFSDLSSAILSQTAMWMPFINIQDITVITSDSDESLSSNAVRLVIEYQVGASDAVDTLTITQTND